MALIKCPECGKDNISDNAVSCPNCGYGIKSHFDKVAEEKKIDKLREERQHELNDTYKQKLETLENMERPSKPVLLDMFLGGKGWIVMLFAVIALALFYCAVKNTIAPSNTDGDMTIVYVMAAVSAIISFATFRSFRKDYDAALSQYQKWDEIIQRKREDIQSDYEKESEKLESTLMDDYRKRNQTSSPMQSSVPMSKGLRCPVCGSLRVKRITNTSRSLSIAMVGLASSKIGKQYECMACKHKW